MTSEESLPRAVMKNDMHTVHRLLEGGASTEWNGEDERDYYEHAAGIWLSLTPADGDYEGMLDLLISYGANLNPDRGVPALHGAIQLAARHGADVTISRIDSLISRGANINHIGDIGPGIMPMPFRGSPLHAYYGSGHQVAETLLQRGADTNIRDSDGRDAQAFFLAYKEKAQSEHEEIDLILESINRLSRNGGSGAGASDVKGIRKPSPFWKKLLGR